MIFHLVTVQILHEFNKINRQVSRFALCVLAVTILSCRKEDRSGNIGMADNTFFYFDGLLGQNDNSTSVLANGDLVLCGNLGNEFTVFSISKNGTPKWRNNFDPGLFSNASGVAVSQNGEIFVCGSTMRNASNKGKDILVVKCNSLGDTLWTRTYGGFHDEYSTCVITQPDSSLLVLGKTESFGADTFGDLYLLKLDFDGDTIWTRRYFDPYQETPFNLLNLGQDVLITGSNEDIDFPREVYLVKVDGEGNLLWSKKADTESPSYGFSSVQSQDNFIYTVGKILENGYSKILLFKFDQNGNSIWQKVYGADLQKNEGSTIKCSNNGELFIGGVSNDSYNGMLKALVLKVNSNGSLLSLKYSPMDRESWGFNLVNDDEDGFIYTGNSLGQIFLSKVNNEGNFD